MDNKLLGAGLIGAAGVGGLHNRYGLDNLKSSFTGNKLDKARRYLTDSKMRDLVHDSNNKLDLAGSLVDTAKLPLAAGVLLAQQQGGENNMNEKTAQAITKVANAHNIDPQELASFLEKNANQQQQGGRLTKQKVQRIMKNAKPQAKHLIQKLMQVIEGLPQGAIQQAARGAQKAGKGAESAGQKLQQLGGQQ